jgi:hypothetical protein
LETEIALLNPVSDKGKPGEIRGHKARGPKISSKARDFIPKPVPKLSKRILERLGEGYSRKWQPVAEEKLLRGNISLGLF